MRLELVVMDFDLDVQLLVLCPTCIILQFVCPRVVIEFDRPLYPNLDIDIFRMFCIRFQRIVRPAGEFEWASTILVEVGPDDPAYITMRRDILADCDCTIIEIFFSTPFSGCI